jgi:hypothetical protein
VGGEFLVNTYTPQNQAFSVVGSNSNGDFVIAWQSPDQDGSAEGVFARRFNRTGSPQGAAFQVNTHTQDGQTYPTIDLDADGDFVIAWTSRLQGGVFAQRFASSGAPRGVEFQVNTVATINDLGAAIGVDADGDFVVAWRSFGRDGDGYAVALRRFSSSGAPQGIEVVVNSFTVGTQGYPAVDLDADGDFVVTWHSATQDSGSYGVFGQRFGSSGAPLGPEFQINTYVTGKQAFSTVSLDAEGDFVVAWHSEAGQDGSMASVLGRRFNSAGTPLSGEFPVNSHTPDNQWFPHLSSDADGDFVVVWQSNLQDGSNSGVFARRFKASGFPQGLDQQVNTYTSGIQGAEKVAADADGDFVVTWASERDGPGFEVFARRFDVPMLVDVDGDGAYLPLTDALLLLRFAFGFSGAALTTGAVGPGCTRCDPASITAYLQGLV